MNSDRQSDWPLKQHSSGNWVQVPNSFEEAVEAVENFALQEFDREVVRKQLYYHNRAHVNNVCRRVDRIFQCIYPSWQPSWGHTASKCLGRMKLLLELCAIAHDMVQEFIPHQPHEPRRREIGMSEQATLARLLDYIEALNQQIDTQNPNSSARFQDSDLQIIREAIEATICSYDPTEQAIYQPALYDPDKNLSAIGRIIALADIGSLGIDGIESYNQEGSLIFLEENLDIVPFLLNRKICQLDLENPELYENFRQRLLKRSRFQVNFAKSRVARYKHEVASFSSDSISALTNEVFKHLNRETIREIEAATPTDESTPLEALLHFFQLERYASEVMTWRNS